MRRVLITGVAGFIGSNLAERLLRAGYAVTGIDDLSSGRRSQVPRGVRFRRADARSPSIAPLFRGAGAVFHLAAKNCISDCQADPVATAEANVVGTVNVLECARRWRIARVIYAESSALYEGARRLPSAEGDVAPRSFYAQSKMAARLFAQAYARFCGLRATALRYFNVYGPRQDYRRTVPPVMSAFILSLLRGKRPVIYGSGKKRRDFIYVDDVNDFHLLCLRDPRAQGGTYNLGSGTNASILEVLAGIGREIGSGLRPVFRPDLPGEARATLADIARARRLGWRPKTSLALGLKNSIEYIRRNVLGKGVI